MNTQDNFIENTDTKLSTEQNVPATPAVEEDDDWLSSAPGYNPENPAGDICEACQ